MIDTKGLRRLAEEQQWIGRWYDAGCETLMAERNGEHEEVAHPMPIGLVPYLVAVQPAAITSLLDRLEAAEKERDTLRAELSTEKGWVEDYKKQIVSLQNRLEASEHECTEQARLNGIGAERELALMAKLEAAEKEVEIERMRLAACGVAALGYFEGCAEEYISASLNDVLALRAKIEAMENQEPVGRALLCVRCSTPFDGEHYCPACGHHTATEEAVYAIPGAQPAPSLASNDVSLISEGKTQPAQSVKDDIIDDLQSQFDTEGITEHDSGDALIRLSGAIAAVEDNFAQPAPSVPEGWLRAVDEALVTAYVGVANADDTYELAKAKLNNLIGFHVDVATDPAVNGGWKLMPIEPTKEIYECFAAYDGTSYSNPFDFDDFKADYAFALAAAPEAKP